MRRFALVILAGLLAGWTGGSHATQPARAVPCTEALIDVHGHALFVDLTPGASPTVVFEAGGGMDSTEWRAIAIEVAKLGVQTFVYDRAGLGKSEPDLAPYAITREVDALSSALEQCGVTGDKLLVAHSYGGYIAQLLAARDRSIKGVVLVDAIVPGIFDNPDRLERFLASFRPQLPQLRREQPAMGHVLTNMIDHYAETNAVLERTPFPRLTRVIDIVAEKPVPQLADDFATWKEAHARFDRAALNRTSYFAAGSGHLVARDRPDVVIDAIRCLLDQVRPAPAAVSQERADHAPCVRRTQ